MVVADDHDPHLRRAELVPAARTGLDVGLDANGVYIVLSAGGVISAHG
ncbi:hypothetical protein ACH4YO_16490 [Streptomyces noursei]